MPEIDWNNPSPQDIRACLLAVRKHIGEGTLDTLDQTKVLLSITWAAVFLEGGDE